MSNIPTRKTCSECNDISVIDAHNHGLVKIHREADGSITTDVMSVLPVKAYICKSCGNIDLKINPNLDKQVS